MQIVKLNKLDQVANQALGETVLVLGYFDGLHRGHKALFEKARAIADEKGLTVSVLTFPESPRLAFQRFQPDLLLHLTSEERRHELLSEAGVDTLYLTDFTSEFAAQEPAVFVERFVNALQAQVVVAGFDYHFGKGRATVQNLAELFAGSVVIVDEVTFEKKKISSTRIRQAVQAGDVTLANQLLGYTLTTDGLVVHGDARGREIGFPTANLAVLGNVYVPGEGVYVTDVEVGGKRYRAMTSVGENVTFGGTEMRVEAHIFNFSDMIYGKPIRIFWLEKLRGMIKFDSMEELIQQMEHDQQQSIDWKPEKNLVNAF